MRRAVELTDVHNVAFVFQYGGFVVIDVQVIGRGEDRHDGWESVCFCLAIHTIPIGC